MAQIQINLNGHQLLLDEQYMGWVDRMGSLQEQVRLLQDKMKSLDPNSQEFNTTRFQISSMTGQIQRLHREIRSKATPADPSI